MTPLVRSILLGTGQSTGVAVTGPVAELIPSDGSREWRSLLAAGAWGVWRRAGRAVEQAPEAPEAAPPDDLPACSPAAALVLETMLRSAAMRTLLPAALRRLARASQRVPHALLPALLSAGHEPLALGPRAVWLASQNPAWARAEPTGDFATGRLSERVAALRRAREADPSGGLALLESVWAEERHDVRQKLLAGLAVGLSTADEPFLERALDDRAAGVRRRAQTLLASLPDGALSARMCARATPLLTWSGGRLNVELPGGALDDASARDGVVLDARMGLGPRAWWVAQLLGGVPPQHWEHLWGTSADAILAGVDTEDAAAAVGLLLACVRFDAEGWFHPLWAWWRTDRGTNASAAAIDMLVQAMPAPVLAELAEGLLAESDASVLTAMLGRLPAPWPESLSRRLLFQLKGPADAAHLGPVLGALARSMPDDVLSAARLDMNDHLESEPRWRRQLADFIELIDTRVRLVEEVPL
jgi:hypothetical protein